jgi:hypothetical protein
MHLRKKLTIICGHYGCGKTNLSINLAVECSRLGNKVTLIDMDVVNPYFRSSDYADILSENGVDVVGPTYANTNLDTPSLPASIGSLFDDDGYIIVDVGGDDAGSTALGQYSGTISNRDYDMLYVINRYRSQTTTPEETAEILREIERTCRLRATAIVNNSHLKQLTTAETITDSLDYADRTAKLLGLEIAYTTAPRPLSHSLNNISDLYPLDVYVRTPWEKE